MTQQNSQTTQQATAKKKHLLVTGGAGYIGSHTCLQLLKAGHQITILDNFSNSSAISVQRMEALSKQKITVIEGDVRDRAKLDTLFSANDITGVIHFAGLKAVGESAEIPLSYYQNNVAGTLTLLEAMKKAGVRSFVFSSSATVYGDPETLPITEQAPRSATNPYGQTKLMCEHILEDLHKANPEWRIALLRYFNPVGAHSSGQMGEDPQGIPNNLMPFISQVATGKRKELAVFGNDYNTPDGTGVRDYIHVEDLAAGHLAAINFLSKQNGGVLETINLGTGQGISVLEMVRAFETASGQKVPYQIQPLRPGDVASCYADGSKARALLGWTANKGVKEMCEDAWRWQSQNPNGYE